MSLTSKSQKNCFTTIWSPFIFWPTVVLLYVQWRTFVWFDFKGLIPTGQTAFRSSNHPSPPTLSSSTSVFTAIISATTPSLTPSSLWPHFSPPLNPCCSPPHILGHILVYFLIYHCFWDTISTLISKTLSIIPASNLTSSPRHKMSLFCHSFLGCFHQGYASQTGHETENCIEVCQNISILSGFSNFIDTELNFPALLAAKLSSEMYAQFNGFGNTNIIYWQSNIDN